MLNLVEALNNVEDRVNIDSSLFPPSNFKETRLYLPLPYKQNISFTMREDIGTFEIKCFFQFSI